MAAHLAAPHAAFFLAFIFGPLALHALQPAAAACFGLHFAALQVAANALPPSAAAVMTADATARESWLDRLLIEFLSRLTL
ncbi:hypothetical protein D7S70_14680 [Ralstonia pickettii]|nr:hypothetical protein [Ralstonia pickettii]MBA9878703.1 hypothetical protein [Ralstonia pickettii]MBA9881936.1 hypothetical protein [Ralstonia pickettii]MBA9888779.1 hypothetical protein [Ralstonia pickettii]MBA9892053.1 hypothetical protein [Ralstonia pickettii]